MFGSSDQAIKSVDKLKIFLTKKAIQQNSLREFLDRRVMRNIEEQRLLKKSFVL